MVRPSEPQGQGDRRGGVESSEDQTSLDKPFLKETLRFAAMREGLASVCRNEPQEVFPWSHCRFDQTVLDGWF